MSTVSAARPPLAAFACLGLVLSLAACGAPERIANIGRTPQLTQIEDPTRLPGYRPLTMPMPAPELAQQQPNSLWRQGSRAFFKDQRAGRVGDILTVLIDIEDQAQLDNSSSRSRDNAENAGLSHFLGFESELASILPDAVDPNNLVTLNSDGSSKGTGAIKRRETISLRIAATITQVLPNGNFVIDGRQEVRVNNEIRELQVAGVIRPEDITAINTVSYDKIAEARIAYGGRGQMTDVQQPRYGQQFYDIVAPF
ncbi:MAG: flagellar basal body L-ring protein FlgH [Rhodospirillaceae bacterium]|nr:flagellar basal body L-ring protein FlgH [Rhodospirillaceae bacterium]